MTLTKLSNILSLSLLANQYPSLHGVRVLGILLVIQFHVLGATIGTIDPAHNIFKLGSSLWFGMDLFFILSGFLIGTLLLLSMKKQGSFSMKNFYIRRSFRIIPLYYVVLTAFILMSEQLPDQGKHIWAEYLYLSNYLEYSQILMYWNWSLAVEEHFYIIVPIVMLLLNKVVSTRKQLLILSIGWLSCFFVRLYIWQSHDGPWSPRDWFTEIYMPTHTRYDSLLAGIWLAIFQKEFGEKVAGFLKSTFLLRLVLLLFPIVAFGLIVGNHDSWYKPTLFRSLSIGTLTCLGWVPLLIYLMNYPGWLSNFFGHSVFRRLATLGYGVYLVHIIVINQIVKKLGDYLVIQNTNLYMMALGCFLVTVILSFFVAYFLHILIEKPALLIRDKLT